MFAPPLPLGRRRLYVVSCVTHEQAGVHCCPRCPPLSPSHTPSHTHMCIYCACYTVVCHVHHHQFVTALGTFMGTMLCCYSVVVLAVCVFLLCVCLVSRVARHGCCSPHDEVRASERANWAESKRNESTAGAGAPRGRRRRGRGPTKYTRTHTLPLFPT